MQPRDRVTLEQILHSAKRIHKLVEGLSLDAFLEEELRYSTIWLHLIIMGEATKRLSLEVRLANRAIPWRDMAGLRDVLIHGYDKVDLEELWGIVQESVPPTIEGVQALLDSEPSE